jgi:uncharacterized protein (TIGR02453 family)
VFSGFTSTAVAFFAALEQHNNRDWWAANRTTYDTQIRPTFETLIGGVESFDSWRVYRPNNSVRFQKDADPYKTFIGAVAERPDGVGAFIQINSGGLRVGTGNPMPAPDQLIRLRAAIASPTGEGLVTAIAQVEAAGARVFHGRWDPLKRVPTGFDAAHPRADLLHWKGIEVDHRVGQPTWLDIASAAREISRLIALGEPIHAWLGEHVGPSDLTPEERFAPKPRKRP